MVSEENIATHQIEVKDNGHFRLKDKGNFLDKKLKNSSFDSLFTLIKRFQKRFQAVPYNSELRTKPYLLILSPLSFLSLMSIDSLFLISQIFPPVHFIFSGGSKEVIAPCSRHLYDLPFSQTRGGSLRVLIFTTCGARSLFLRLLILLCLFDLMNRTAFLS